ncbi:MAG: transcription-repair coupling factor [Lachnospiraceae bacterium]|nr:transcription-repair coupling factor [Lachnospiraceae bacterium]
MKALTGPLSELAGFEEAKKNLSDKKCVGVSGCVDSQKWNLAFSFAENYSDRLIITYSDKRVKEIYEDYRLYDKNVRMFPAKDAIFYQADVHGTKITRERIGCYKRLIMGLPCTLITTFGGLMNAQAGLDILKNRILRISVGETLDLSELTRGLCALGYEKTYQVESGGQFAVRGGIVDVYDFTENNPYRIELWGDEVDSIRSFDAESQRSIERLESISIYPACELPLSEDELLEGLKKIDKETEKVSAALAKAGKPEEAHRLRVHTEEVREQITELPWTFNADSYIRYFCDDLLSLADFFKDGLFILDEPGRILEHAEAVEAEFNESMKARLEKGYILPGQADILLSADSVFAKLKSGSVLLLSAMQTKKFKIKQDYSFDIGARSIPSYNNSFADLVRDLKSYRKRGYRVLLLSGSKTRAERLAKDLRDNEVEAFFSEDREHKLIFGEVMTMYGRVLKGFEYPDLRFAIISESDIFGTAVRKQKKKYEHEGKKIRDFNDLHVGDYVVHESHGIGIYKGIEKVEVDHVSKDYMRIEYKDNGVLFVPATSLDAIMKYASADAKKPKINKLGGGEWSKTTARVKTAVDEVARELVELYAKRREKSGFVFSGDTVWQREFEELFPYEETDDQLEAIEATKADMESSKIMDRLICGDVGFGKTEVAIRAAFKAVQDGKQVAFLVPTTILAQQHFNTFTERMKEFPVRIKILSRFVSKKDQTATLAELKSGMTDIVIGTHRLLSKDVAFKDLGLLIVDEEQRFGVAHKERIKQIKSDVDVLTLTATPIPRTLHMSLVGIRDMSLLEEPPEDRLPIQTYVMEYNEEMVREAINRELSRGGQVYYVYNHVSNISDIAGRLKGLLPDATVAFAHGQMKESELERIMYDFIRGDIDVLVSTTIVETGIDIPNVNTIIVHDSDKMGLSQLYQLRGRVGRSNRTAYAFLMYKRDRILEEVAEKRLQTIKEFTDLGSGYKIAMKDLEIRGAGNVLGMSQHGHMAEVGYDLYCKMLNKAVLTMKGEAVEEDFATTVDLNVDAFIPGEYILNELQKLDTYKRIALISGEEEAKDMRDELIDRFGAVPAACEHLIRISLIRGRAHKLFITDIKGVNGRIAVTFRPDARINVANIDTLLRRHAKKLELHTYGAPEFVYTYRPVGEVMADERLLLESTENIILEMEELLTDL